MKPLTVLIVDDNVTFRRILWNLIDGCEYFQVIGEARNGAEALQFLDEHAPDVVLLDLEMPVMNGFDVIQALGKRLTDVHVFVVSGYADRMVHSALHESGVKACVLKEDVGKRLIPDLLSLVDDPAI